MHVQPSNWRSDGLDFRWHAYKFASLPLPQTQLKLDLMLRLIGSVYSSLLHFKYSYLLFVSQSCCYHVNSPFSLWATLGLDHITPSKQVSKYCTWSWHWMDWSDVIDCYWLSANAFFFMSRENARKKVFHIKSMPTAHQLLFLFFFFHFL